MDFGWGALQSRLGWREPGLVDEPGVCYLNGLDITIMWIAGSADSRLALKY